MVVETMAGHVERVLDEMLQREASDLHLTADAPAFLRTDGRLRQGASVSREALEQWLGQVLGSRTCEMVAVDGRDFSMTYRDRRLRGNAYQTEGKPAIALRLLPEHIPTLSDIGATPAMTELTRATQGLILATGRTGAGKSTTLASLLLALVEKRGEKGQGVHCITLEDPLEFHYHAEGHLFHQRELGRDFSSFARAIRDALREDPDVLLISELRDQETIRAALAAAEAGTLVLSTLHARTAADAPQRLSDFFPAEERAGIRAALAASLTAVIAQRLVRAPAGRRAVFELLFRTPAVCRMIHDGDDAQIASAMLAGARQGMTTFAQEGRRLFTSGAITREGLDSLLEGR